jgi:hypothetical protein
MKSYSQKFSEKRDVVSPVAVSPDVSPVAVSAVAIAVPEVPRDGPWTKLGVTEAEYKVSRARIEYNMQVWENQRQEEIRRLRGDPWNDIRFWETRHNILEISREKLNKKARWSATDSADADYIDSQRLFAEERLDDLYN